MPVALRRVVSTCHLKFLCMGYLSFLPSFISVICLYQYWSLWIFSLYFELKSSIISFIFRMIFHYYSNCISFWPFWAFLVDSYVPSLWYPHRSFSLFSTSVFSDSKILQSYFVYYSASVLKTAIAFAEPWFLLLENCIRNQDLGTVYALCYRDVSHFILPADKALVEALRFSSCGTRLSAAPWHVGS